MPEVIEKRTRSSKTHSLGGKKFAWDGTIGSIHYKDAQDTWQNIDNEFLPVAAPWDWEMVKAGYHARFKEDFTAGQIAEFEVRGETVQFQPHALELTCDSGAIQPISMPQNVIPIITNPEVDLLPAVGVPSHQGTIRWPDAYGQGIDFEWRCATTRLMKTLEIENLNNLPVPSQEIIDGGNPVLRLNLIFDPPKKQDVDIVVDGQVWGRASKVQTFKMIEFVKDGEVLWGFMPLRYWGSGEGGDNFGQSVATLEKRGNKLYISIRVPYEWLQNAFYPVFIDTDVDEDVGASADDAYEDEDWGDVYINYAHVPIGGSAGEYCTGGFRFADVIIPGGATIGTCYLSFYPKEDDSGVVRYVWYGEDGANPAQFSTALRSITGRDYTDAYTDENPPANWSVDVLVNSASIQGIIAELYASYDYSAGAPMVLIGDYDQTGSGGERISRSWDYDDHSKAAKLHIEYEAGEPAGAVPQAFMHLQRMRRQG